VSKKRGKDVKQLVGAPEIARPNQRQCAFVRALLLDAPSAARGELKALFEELLPYEKQLALVYDWFFKMLEWIESGDEKVALEARGELQTLFLPLLGQSMRLAKRKKKDNATERWAGELLAIIGVSIEKQAKKLRKANAAYAEMEKKLSGKGLTYALFPTYVCGIVQRELRKALQYWKKLLLLKAMCGKGSAERVVILPDGKGGHVRRVVEQALKGWKQVAREQKIPEAYWPFLKLPEFSEKSEPEWWDFLWPLIMKKIDVAKLDSRYEMARKRHPSDSQKTARDHLILLARLRDTGIFY
jgi:hypothetical protein